MAKTRTANGNGKKKERTEGSMTKRKGGDGVEAKEMEALEAHGDEAKGRDGETKEAREETETGAKAQDAKDPDGLTAMGRLMERTKEKTKKTKTGWRDMWKIAACTALLAPLFVCMPVNATDIVTRGFNVIYDIISAIVQSVGALLLLWGLFEWAQALNTQDGGSQSMAFKRVASGLVALIAPQLIPLIRNAVGGAG